MRIIEKEMLNAVNTQGQFSKGNTVVSTINGISKIMLHGHLIAKVDHSINAVMVIKETLKNWPTVTTKSRLRALGINVYTKKGITFLNDQKL